jgi:pimeloyl-ACP methyl ester carboxylesterase
MIKPFKVNIEQHKLDDLKNRLQQTRWPDEIENSGWQYGANLKFMKELQHYWLYHYDWRETENEINQYENYIAEIDGYNIHFIHKKSVGENAIPIIITHGWPGSFLEMMKLIPLLTESPAPVFDVVVPSLLGYGFSSKVNKEGCNVELMADLWLKLMLHLGYEKFAVQGGDFGAGVSAVLAYKYPDHVTGIHLNYIPGNYVPVLNNDSFSAEEKEYLASEEDWYRREGGYSHQQRTKPQTLAYALNDSPAGLCAWITEKMLCWADCSTGIENVFSKHELLSNVSLYWLTETIHSSIRLYGENSKFSLKIDEASRIKTPAGIARFRYEEPFPPRKFIERGFNIVHWTDFPNGGHFAAMEKPFELTNDIKNFFRKIAS